MTEEEYWLIAIVIVIIYIVYKNRNKPPEEWGD
jgi:hypothetical protein